MRIERKGFGLHAERHGSPAGPPLMLVHGLAGTAEDWESLLPHLPPSWNTCAIDLPGHGQSNDPPPGGWSFEGFADSLEAAARTLGNAPPVWMGYSFGARILLHVALRYPARVKALILLSVHPGISGPDARAARANQDAEDARLLEDEGVQAFLDRWLGRSAFDARRERPGWAQEVARKRRTNRANALATCLRNLGLGVQEDLTTRVSRLKVPTLLMVGQGDSSYVDAAQRLARAWPSSSVRVVPGVGHAPHLEAPMKVGREVSRFLARQMAPSHAAAPSH